MVGLAAGQHPRYCCNGQQRAEFLVRKYAFRKSIDLGWRTSISHFFLSIFMSPDTHTKKINKFGEDNLSTAGWPKLQIFVSELPIRLFHFFCYWLHTSMKIVSY